MMPIPNPLPVMSIPQDSRRRGFTLIEVLIVISIIVLMAGLTISKMTNIFSGSQADIAKLFFAYRINMGGYPSTEEGLQALLTAPASKADRWRGPYIEGNSIPQDPWGEPYLYRYPGVHNKDGYDLWSKGPDKTDGAVDNIGNW